MFISKKCINFYIALFWCTSSFSFQEFLYPIASIKHNKKQKICVLYQKDSHLEIWFWDPKTLEAVKGLLSSFTPAGVRVLPCQTAFSFIDNDRIRIKDTLKRSPCTLDLPYGPYDLSTIEWINNQSFYFCAQERGSFNIFHATREGELFHLTRSTDCNYMYPQKINDLLFYLVKDSYGDTTIEQVEYPIKSLPRRSLQSESSLKEQIKRMFEEENETLTKTYIDLKTKKVLYTWRDHNKELAFLCMKNKNKGYFLTHPSSIGRNDDHMIFECYTLICKQEVIIKKLFSFNVPLHLLMPQYNQSERLYESILPLLPLYHEDNIYYSHDSDVGLRLYKYNETTGISKELISTEENHHHLAPLCFDNKIYYGGTVCHGDGHSYTSPQMWLDDNGEQRFIFPVV